MAQRPGLHKRALNAVGYLALSGMIVINFGFIKSTVASEDMSPLSSTLSRGQSEFPWNVLMILDRCAGLYTASLAMDGAGKLGDAGEDLKKIVVENHTMAARIRAETSNNITLEQAFNETWRQIRNASDMYVSRMERNKMAHGTLFERDKIIKSDLATCQYYLNQIYDDGSM